LRVTPDGDMTYVNCGHIQPVLVRHGQATRLIPANLPIGLLGDAQYESSSLKLQEGDRLILVTDGVTEAEDATGEFFGEDRLEHAASATEDACFEHVFASIKRFCGTTPLSDDCTLVELIYKGQSRTATSPNVKFPTTA
jgi:sigma-B regulation protein RsbU (phosphoserine phosphatase)